MLHSGFERLRVVCKTRINLPTHGINQGYDFYTGANTDINNNFQRIAAKLLVQNLFTHQSLARLFYAACTGMEWRVFLILFLLST